MAGAGLLSAIKYLCSEQLCRGLGRGWPQDRTLSRPLPPGTGHKEALATILPQGETQQVAHLPQGQHGNATGEEWVAPTSHTA